MDGCELDFVYPKGLVAVEPNGLFRAVWSEPMQDPREVDRGEFFGLFQKGDILVINDTKVVKRRVFSQEGWEVLFVKPVSELEWEILAPLRRIKKKGSNCIQLPQGRELRIVKGGLPQRGILNQKIDEAYFQSFGEMALPPYIQKARGQRHMRGDDQWWYQTQWATSQGSCAAPTASLHFSKEDLETLRVQGVRVAPMTLHVGLGTFLPIREELDQYEMHSEWTHIPRATVMACESCEGRIWALGSTVARSLESLGAGLLEEQVDGSLSGFTDLFIRPGFHFKYVDVLMTNFHQPRSTLLSMVYAFAGQGRVREVYQWAIHRKFLLFSYGNLSLWTK